MSDKDYHIIPHPTKKQIKKMLIPAFKEISKLLKKEIKPK